jgi:hypothetical protein
MKTIGGGNTGSERPARWQQQQLERTGRVVSVAEPTAAEPDRQGGGNNGFGGSGSGSNPMPPDTPAPQ